jgi:hypothetical protein
VKRPFRISKVAKKIVEMYKHDYPKVPRCKQMELLEQICEVLIKNELEGTRCSVEILHGV